MEAKLRFLIAYRGDAFHGWAKQESLDTVQGRIEAALEVVLRSPASLVVAGRTDAGVHALGQVAHLALTGEQLAAILRLEKTELPAISAAIATGTELPTETAGHVTAATKSFTARINKLLRSGVNYPHAAEGTRDIIIKATEIVPATFDARFSALWREYEYLICDQIQQANPLRSNITEWYGTRLDVSKMHQAAQAFCGEHDFLAFAKPREGASTVRTLHKFTLERTEEDLIKARIKADAFCHSQVRFMMGALMQIGAGRRPVTWIAQLLAENKRDGSVPLAPGTGLTLAQVGYPDPAEYALQAQRARVYRG